MKKIIFILFLAINCQVSLKAQKLLQLSGLVLTSDSLMGIPFAAVLINGSGRGTISDHQGFFSLVVNRGDEIEFRCVGHKSNFYKIPDTLSQNRYSVIELLSRDTVYLPETQIYPWPTKEQFKQAFLSMNVPEDDYERAKRNLEREQMREIGMNMKYDANENADMYFRNESYKYYYYGGQIPPMNIFNPLAWAKFIESWKNGDFKRKKSK